MGQIWDILKISFSTFWFTDFKSSRFVPFRADLTQFEANPYIPAMVSYFLTGGEHLITYQTTVYQFHIRKLSPTLPH